MSASSSNSKRSRGEDKGINAPKNKKTRATELVLDMCPICMEDIKGASKTCANGHKCCRECADKWIESQITKGLTATCPTCRVALEVPQSLARLIVMGHEQDYEVIVDLTSQISRDIIDLSREMVRRGQIRAVAIIDLTDDEHNNEPNIQPISQGVTISI